MLQPLLTAIGERPEGWDDDCFSARGDEGAEGFGEGEVPACERCYYAVSYKGS